MMMPFFILARDKLVIEGQKLTEEDIQAAVPTFKLILSKCVIILYRFWKQYKDNEGGRLSTVLGNESQHEKIGRNDLCFCGSGKKYKKCCMNKIYH